MNRLRIGLTLFLAGLPAIANSECRAAATVAYTVKDLGSWESISSSGIDAKPFDDPHAGSSAIAPQVDNSGVIHYTTGQYDAGDYRISSEGNMAVLNKSGSFIAQFPFPLPANHPYSINYPISFGAGVNASGEAVGYGSAGVKNFADYNEAFVYNPKAGQGTSGLPQGFSAIPGAYPGTITWYAEGINATGMIVGVTAPKGPTTPWATDPNKFDEGRAFLSDGRTTVDLNTLIAPDSGFLLSSATSINDLGQIAGWAIDANDNQFHVFLLTPTATPEPAPWMLAVAAFGYLGLARLRSHGRAE